MPHHEKAVGSRAEVWHGTAKHTAGGLKKDDLMKKDGRIISRRKHHMGLKNASKLKKYATARHHVLAERKVRLHNYKNLSPSQRAAVESEVRKIVHH